MNAAQQTPTAPSIAARPTTSPFSLAPTRAYPAPGGASRVTSILGIAGSLRHDSLNRKLLAAAARTLLPGTEMVFFERIKEIPPFDADDEFDPAPAVAWLRAQIADADAVLIATPEYNGSLPGQLKNALDWASRPDKTNVLRGKPVAVIGASPSPGGTAHANADTCRILARIGAQVSEQTLLVPRAFAQLNEDGSPASHALSEQLAQVTSSLAAAGNAARQARAA
jgi:chromate reductase